MDLLLKKCYKSLVKNLLKINGFSMTLNIWIKDRDNIQERIRCHIKRSMTIHTK